MGLIKSELSRDFMYWRCEKFGDHVVAKDVSELSDDNLVMDSECFIVEDGQIAVVAEEGRITEFSAEPGLFKWDSQSLPSRLIGDSESVIGYLGNERKAFSWKVSGFDKFEGIRFSGKFCTVFGMKKPEFDKPEKYASCGWKPVVPKRLPKKCLSSKKPFKASRSMKDQKRDDLIWE